MSETGPTRTVTVTMTFELSFASGVEALDEAELATHLAMSLRMSDLRLSGTFSISDPVVFTGPVAAVLDVTGGTLRGVVAAIPLQAVGVDYEPDLEDCNCDVLRDGDRWLAEVHRLHAEVDPDRAAAVLAAAEGIDPGDGSGAWGNEPRWEDRFARVVGDRGEIGLD